MIVDASTLILLAKTEFLDAFIGQAGECIISRHVYEESVVAGKNKRASFDALLIGRRVDEGKIKVKVVGDEKAVEEIMMAFNLGRGEAETLVLGLRNPDSGIATDDGKAIKAARVLGLNFVTALAFVIRQSAAGVIGKEKAVDLIRKLKRYGRYKTELIEFALKEAEKNG